MQLFRRPRSCGGNNQNREYWKCDHTGSWVGRTTPRMYRATKEQGILCAGFVNIRLVGEIVM